MVGTVVVILRCSGYVGGTVDMADIVGESDLLGPKHAQGAEERNQQAEMVPSHHCNVLRYVTTGHKLIAVRRGWNEKVQ